MIRLPNAAIAAIALALPVLAMPAAAQERFTVTVTGEGPDVILIPGLASSGAVWDATVEQLAPIHRVHVLQVRGFAGEPAGANAEGPVLQPLITEVADYAATLDHPVLIGHSLGGLVAIEVAAAKPDAVSRVMAVDALSFYSLLYGATATVEGAKPFAEQALVQTLAMTDEQFAAGQSRTMAMLVKKVSARAAPTEWSLASDRRVLSMAMHDDMLDDARPRLPAIKAPVTVLYAYDPAMGAPALQIDQMYASAYDTLPSANLKRIDGAFHFIMLDQPEAFAAAVADFMK